MGTRAAFWVGDPTDLINREWLGCIAWDGHPENFAEFVLCASADDFRIAVQHIAASRSDFAFPDKGWPFPWDDDIFLTDCTYAFFDGTVRFCWFHKPFMSLGMYLEPVEGEELQEYHDDPCHLKIPAPDVYDPTQPDSIMILRL